MRRTIFWLAGALLCASLAACDKAEERPAARPAAGAAPAAPVAAKPQGDVGKNIRMDLGSAKLDEAQLGLPFYPGARPLEGGSTFISSGDVSTASVNLHSADGSDKIAAYYREQMKSRAAGKQFTDTVDGSGNPALALIDTRAKSSIEVAVLKAEAGSTIQIVSSWRGPAPAR